MDKLEKFSVIELEKKELILIDGGFWSRLLIAVVYDIINNPNDFVSGFNDARNN